ncbi:MAG TPA: DoxX family protein [Cytophagales bacterium]|nr:DoxX family protein [Cytophagales bacterium]HAA20821.1 DoxX family protein [Cytophagales bacterium]HAP59109.1 DoxX family protein [Cytophagales bacterium]
MKKLLTLSGQRADLGLLIIRVAIGASMMVHGLPKLQGGPERWEGIGSNMENLGIAFGYTFWGFMAGFAEFIGGLLVIIGLATRPAVLLLIFTMAVATLRHVVAGDGFRGWSHAAELGIVFLGLYFTGPGKYSLDKRILN